jgi:predicted nucleic acid-binding Zn ribbon protein
MNRKFTPLNSTLKNILQKYELEEDYIFQNIKSNWDTILDNKINMVIKPVKLEKKILYIEAKTDYWKNELDHLNEQILKKVNSNINPYRIDEIKII